jgi:fructose-1,6-bisphosphatase I
MYECNPLAWIVEQAGGVATNGNIRILDIKPENIHQRTPLYIGSSNLVNKAMEFLNQK